MQPQDSIASSAGTAKQSQSPDTQLGASVPITPIQPGEASVASQSTPPEPERRWMMESPWAKVSWPSFHLPRFSSPEPDATGHVPPAREASKPRNTWVEPTPESVEPSPLEAMKDSARRVRNSTKNAWDRTVDVLTPGSSSPSTSARSSIAQRQVRPPFWKRMLADEQQKEPETVPEWMAQERLNP